MLALPPKLLFLPGTLLFIHPRYSRNDFSLFKTSAFALFPVLERDSVVATTILCCLSHNKVSFLKYEITSYLCLLLRAWPGITVMFTELNNSADGLLNFSLPLKMHTDPVSVNVHSNVQRPKRTELSRLKSISSSSHKDMESKAGVKWSVPYYKAVTT